MVNKTNISLIDHAYISKDFIEQFFTNATAENIYCSDHYAVIIIIEKNNVNFRTIP